MSKYHFKPIALLACCLLISTLSFFSFPGLSQADAPSSRQDTLVLGAISSNPKKHIAKTQPLANYLAANLGSMGIKKGRVVVAADLEEMGKLLQEGKVDVVSETVFSALELEQRFGAEMLLRRWKKGVATYHSIFFARKERGFHSLDDLKGKVVAFEDRGSTSGYFIPASILLNQGYELVELASPHSTVPPDKIGFVFTRELLKTSNEISISAWVYRGMVDAGVLSSVNWNEPEDMPERIRGELNIIHRSIPFPRSIQLVRPGLAANLKAEIKRLLLAADESEPGKKALAAYQKTKQFDELDNQTTAAISKAADLRVIVESRLQMLAESSK